ncbi:MAG: cation:proton antiporter, partial [Candidatus Levybacteria bacterium]|nr:cation:proton antiporter [Candidatus Levybacteria bacterium]
MGNIFFELTLILCLVAFLSIVFKILKQPIILAYILTGIIIGPFGQLQLGSNQFLQAMGQFGITLLLFMLGLEMRLKELQSIGRTAIVVGIGQLLSTLFLSFTLSSALNFSAIESFYIAAALTFSSTIIVVKILADKKDLKSLYGRISIGLLLIQDFFAVLILVLLSGSKLQSASSNFIPIGLALLKAAILFLSVIYLSKYIFPKFIDKIAKSEESLFLFSLAWVFGLSAIVSSKQIGFSVEIGGFLAGIALANASENFQIIARMKALRDFFITIFFVYLGMKMMFNNFFSVLLLSVIFSLFVIIIKPLTVMALMGFLGYRKRTSFLTGIGLAQISEFSLIIIFLGNSLGHISDNIVSIVASVLIITFIASSYLIIHANSLFKILGKYFFIFEKKQSKKENLSSSVDLNSTERHVVLIGAHRMGESILDALEDIGDKVIVVDFDPDIV